MDELIQNNCNFNKSLRKVSSYFMLKYKYNVNI